MGGGILTTRTGEGATVTLALFSISLCVCHRSATHSDSATQRAALEINFPRRLQHVVVATHRVAAGILQDGERPPSRECEPTV